MSIEEKIKELFTQILTSKQEINGIIVYKKNKSMLLSQFREDQLENILDRLNENIFSSLEQLFNLEKGKFGSASIDMENYHFLFSSIDSEHILLVIIKQSSSLDKFFPYVFLLAEKVNRILMGKNISLVIPNFDQDEIENPLTPSTELVELGIQEGSFRMKIILGGDSGVGKTTLVSRFVDENFNDDFKSTIGVNIMKKNLHYDKWDCSIDMAVFDTAGQQIFHNVRKTYLKDASAGFIVFDVTRPETFKNVESWYREAKAASPEVMLILVGNKIDLTRRVSTEAAKQLARKYKMGYIETSALDKDLVDEAFYTIGFSFIQRARLMKKLKRK